jgi:DNA-binding response OmpR family regulator
MAKLLLVEDEQDLCQLIKNWLEREHHLVELVHTGGDALHLMAVNKYDLIILDVMLPEITGIEICKRYRRQQGTAPILMLTAKDSIDDKELGFNAGGDDYLTKPFHLKELSVRVRALLRRGINLKEEIFRFKDIEIDTTQHIVKKDNQEIHLLPKEFRLLEFLARHPHKVFSAEELLSSVWESSSEALLDTVRGHIKRLRKKLDSPGEPSIISTVYGIGYKLEAD